MKLAIILIVVLFLGGCKDLSSKPAVAPTVADRMNLIAMDPALNLNEKLVKIRMIEVELEEDRRRVIGRASAYDFFKKNLERMDDISIIMPTIEAIHKSKNPELKKREIKEKEN